MVPPELASKTTPSSILPTLITHNNLIWAVNVDQETAGSILIGTWNALGEQLPITFRVQLPIAGYLHNAQFSPQNDDVAWLLFYSYTSPVAKLMHRLINSVPVRARPMYSIWVSRLDGSHMVEVGHEDMTGWEDTSAYVQWLPGGKKLAFYIDGDLYTIPVDQ
jgi:hypothetical protein